MGEKRTPEQIGTLLKKEWGPHHKGKCYMFSKGSNCTCHLCLIGDLTALAKASECIPLYLDGGRVIDLPNGNVAMADEHFQAICKKGKELEGQARELEDAVRSLRGLRFSDRMYAAIKSRMEVAEAKLKDGEHVCQHMYESDCHGIEMIKSPAGKEWAIGGTNDPNRWTHDPWCGRRIVEVDKHGEPEAPSIVIHSESYAGPMCPKCDSDYPKRFKVLGARYCVNPNCKLHKDTIEIELELKGRGEQLSGRTKAVLHILASRGGRSYMEIERAYRQLKSFDYLVMCMDSAASLNRSLADCVNDFEIREEAGDGAIHVIRPRGQEGNWTVYKRSAPGEEKEMATGDLSYCRQYIRRTEPFRESMLDRERTANTVLRSEVDLLKILTVRSEDRVAQLLEAQCLGTKGLLDMLNATKAVVVEMKNELESLRGSRSQICSDCGSPLVLCDTKFADYVCPRCLLTRARKAEATIREYDEGRKG